MSEENITEEALELVKEAQSQKVFNLADAIKGRAYPVKEVTIYLDDASAMKLLEINEILNKTTDPDENARLSVEADELSKAVLASALTFKMRGIGQAKIDETTKEIDKKHNIGKEEVGATNSEWLKDYITTLISLNIESVTDAEGAVDDSEFTYEKAEGLRQMLAPTEWAKLVGTMQKLTLAGGYFDQLTDAGFLPKS